MQNNQIPYPFFRMKIKATRSETPTFFTCVDGPWAGQEIVLSRHTFGTVPFRIRSFSDQYGRYCPNGPKSVRWYPFNDEPSDVA